MHSAEPRTLRSKDRRQLSPRGDGAGGGGKQQYFKVGEDSGERKYLFIGLPLTLIS